MAGVISAPSINRIADHSMAEVFQVDADLVRAASLRVALHERLAVARFQHTIVGECVASPLDDRHFLAVDGVATDRRIDFSVGHAGDSIDEGEVGFFDIPRGELIGQRAVDLFGFCDNQAARGFLVEAVDNPRALGAPDDFDARAVVEESIGKSAFAIAGTGVHNEAGGFVDHEQVLVFEENPQRNFLRGEGRLGGFFGNFQNHGVPFAENERGFGGGAVHEGASVAYESLQPRSRKIRASGAKETVEPLPGLHRPGEGFHPVGSQVGHRFKLVQILPPGKLSFLDMSGKEDTPPSHSDGIPLLESCFACGEVMDMAGMQPFSRVACSACGTEFIARRRIGHFKIFEPLAEGGLGAVFRAFDTTLDREVALKVLKLGAEGQPVGSETLEREACAMAAIAHPNIVRIFDFGRCHGVFYLAMEFLGGGSLDDLIQACGAVDEGAVLEIGIQTAEALAAALQQGLLHRDIKPANILFSDSRAPKLVDFGPGAQSLCEIWGTPDYIAPEKLDERPEDFRSDIFSLGSTLFHALAGRPPYETENVPLEKLRRLKSNAVDLCAASPGVGQETARVINRMMAIDPAKRQAHYGELIVHLRLALSKMRGVRHIDASR